MPAPLTITEDFQRALDTLRSGRHLFLTGRAGTGKSTLIRTFLETTDRNAITVAPTGIAALNVDGYTIHRLFSFPIGASEEFVRSPRYFPGRFASTLAALEVLIIDEASMVRADLFDALVAALERFGPRPGEPFGGVQLVLVGDLYQLPPVVHDSEAVHLEQHYGTPFFFSAHAFERDAFEVVELSTVFRQQGDDRLVDLLNAVREGTLLEDARAELNARTDKEFEPPLEEFWLTLATTNRIVTSRNRQMLERLPDPVQTFTAQISGETDGFENPTDAQLQLKVGAQVMMLNNDSWDRWVNGTLGRITAIGRDADGPVVEVRLRDGRSEQVRPHTWDVTRPSVDGGHLVHQVIGTFTQLPMKLAWAITIHKSQGQTLDRVVVDLTGGTFANGQLYVALSRCTSLEGLVLRRDVLPRDLKSDARVRRFLSAATDPADPSGALGEVYVAALSVGNVGDKYRPRPVEIAVVTGDGDEATTVVNPTSDLFAARTDYGLTTRDVQLAPLLTEAWPALAPLLAGRIPVGPRIDEELALIDFELKRNGVVDPMPLGIDLPTPLLTAGERAALRAPTALERARAIRDAVQRLRGETDGGDVADSSGTVRAGRTGTADGVAAGSSTAGSTARAPWQPPAGTAFPPFTQGSGFLLARTSGDAGTVGPEGFVVGGNLSAQDDAAQALAEALRTAWERVIDRDPEVVERLRGAEAHFGVRVLPEDLVLEGPPTAADVLVPGSRVCFTGEVVHAERGYLDRSTMERLATKHGLVPVANVTKTRTDVLVVAERGTQSNKSKNAMKWGKPVLVAEEFLEWADDASGR